MMFDSKRRSSNVNYYAPLELLYTPETEEYMDDCDYEKTVLFLSQAGLLDNTSCIMLAFSRRDDTTRENRTETVLCLMELLILRTLST